jgi:hypothetical protein
MPEVFDLNHKVGTSLQYPLRPGESQSINLVIRSLIHYIHRVYRVDMVPLSGADAVALGVKPTLIPKHMTGDS